MEVENNSNESVNHYNLYSAKPRTIVFFFQKQQTIRRRAQEKNCSKVHFSSPEISKKKCFHSIVPFLLLEYISRSSAPSYVQLRLGNDYYCSTRKLSCFLLNNVRWDLYSHCCLSQTVKNRRRININVQN